ncbi:hypothetical protein [uncultured Thiodictyon sp.]|uniref:hypothetical protein n=1 Tax=uncultured Thiodictyon sp. TaxID=1846217 RepID=UPI0025F37DF2|nr:hypothetical protein [uncultured Thiodictyon sp.]
MRGTIHVGEFGQGTGLTPRRQDAKVIERYQRPAVYLVGERNAFFLASWRLGVRKCPIRLASALVRRLDIK